jgi:shikimate dehydrogenase
MNLQNAIEWQTKTKLFVSLAARPGKTGETFYNTLFEYHGINAEYVACVCTDLAADMKLVRAHCAGASITMPFKNEVIPYIDSTAAGPVNTVLNTDGVLTGYNCDLMGLSDAVTEDFTKLHVVILGDGAMSENALALCKGATVTHVSRRKDNWDLRNTQCDVLINTTSIGMNSDEYPVAYIDANVVVDCVIGDTALIRKARTMGARTVSGAEIYLAQFKHQFKIYTGIDPDPAVTAEIAKRFFSYV